MKQNRKEEYLELVRKSEQQLQQLQAEEREEERKKQEV
jgi:hypothetical protein